MGMQVRKKQICSLYCLHFVIALVITDGFIGTGVTEVKPNYSDSR